MDGMTYRCNGRRLTQDEQSAIREAATIADARVAELMDLGIRPKRTPSEAAIPDRMPCGADVTAQILAVPQDGRDYVATCQSCGCEISVMRTSPPVGVSA